MAPMASHKRLPMTAKLAGWRAWFQTAFLVGVARPVFLALSLPVFTGLPLSFLSPGRVGVSDRGARQFQRVARVPLPGRRHARSDRRCIWDLRMWLGLSFRLFAGPRRPDPDAEGASAELAWLHALRDAGRSGPGRSVLIRGEPSAVLLRLCPAGAIEAAVPFTASLAIRGEQMVWPSAAKLSILLIVVVAMLFTWRPWCLLLCPLGAIYGLCNRVSVLALHFRADRCNDCDLCRLLCNYRGWRAARKGNKLPTCLDCTQCTAIKVTTAFRRRCCAGPRRDRAGT